MKTNFDHLPGRLLRSIGAGLLACLLSSAALLAEDGATSTNPPPLAVARELPSLAQSRTNETFRSKSSSFADASSRNDTGFSKKDFRDFIGLSIPIIAIVMGIGMGGFGMALEYRRRREILNICHSERMSALEKGLELPPYPTEVFQDSGRPKKPGRTPQQCLKPGLFLVCIGLGVGTLISLVETAAKGVATGVGVGALLVFIGLGYLAYYRFGPRSDDPAGKP